MEQNYLMAISHSIEQNLEKSQNQESSLNKNDNSWGHEELDMI